MTCDYCVEDKLMMKLESISASSWGWGTPDTKISLDKAEDDMDTYGVFIDRGYLRLVRLDDCRCIESGKKLLIKYCPMCGSKVKEM